MQIQQQKQAAIIKDPDASCDNERSTNHNQNICCISPHNLFEQIYQQSHQMSNKMELMPNQQQQIHNNNNLEKYYYYNQQLIDSPTQGMTSPQDMTITQIKLMQHNPSFNQSVWPQKNRWIETTTQSQQHLHHSLSQHHHMPTINFNQRNFKFQNQSNSSKNYMKHKSTKLVAKDNQRDDRNQVLYFTPDMIRDQELLVSTLRQQDISDEVMRRQFDALLNEQRRHLAYVAQFQQEADTLDTKQPRYMRKRTGEYEKPEWMVHITPPRISCNKVEKITAQQNNSRIQGSMNDQLLEKRNTTMAVHQQNYYQHKKEEVAKQISSYQKYLQNNPDQHIVNWSCRNIPSNHVIFQPYGIPQKIRNTLYYQSNPTFTGYIYHPYNIYSDHSYHSEQQNIWPSNSNISNPITSAYLCKRTKTSTEPSSLLKMKVYKEIICPQKRNNGLQDPDTIHNALEALQNPVLCGKSIIRLNGTQNPNEIPEDIQLQFPIKTNTQFSKKVLSNDLKNSKYFDNFPVHILRSKRQNESIMTKYPQQRQRDGTFFYAHSGKEKHHNNNTTSFQDVPQYYQMQQYYPNEQNEYNGSQGDIAGKQSNTPNATRIFHASGDNIEG
ncbi:uncharacterized protein LOC109862352 [Pseudomyrmex gracilis]|uniref:uncharacterized protein LOC109862352 n=1 Tax=Pseudomyrmex gracilis TaxID=219809 RepID=UPI000995164F|nr:uncharacterized protein LOC109862352 [Pseudomyrmex gracilis]